MNNKKKCFVIMSFSSTKSCTEGKWTEIFEYIIKPAVEEGELSYECERSVAGRENIVKGILEALNKANVVIADLTDNNPNVFYELGVRHTLTNRTILIAQGEEHIPFDLRPYPISFYSQSPAKIAEFKKDIKKKLEDIEKNPERSDNPVADFLKNRNIVLLSFEKSANLKKLATLISELSQNIQNIKTIIEQIEQVKKLREDGQKGPWDTPVRINNACLELLVTTQYVVLPQETLQYLFRINEQVKLINRNLDLWSRHSKQIEERLALLPGFKQDFERALQTVNQLRLDYANNNYFEPNTPSIVLAEPEHEEYLKLVKEAK